MSYSVKSLSKIAQCLWLTNKVVVSSVETKQIRGLTTVANTSIRMEHALENVELLPAKLYIAWAYILEDNGMAN